MLPCGSLPYNPLLPVRMSPPGFNQDSSQYPPSISGMDQASPPHTYLPPCHLPYMSLTALLSSHTAPPRHWFLSSFVSVIFFIFYIQPLNAPPVSKRKRGKGQQITNMRLFKYLHCLSTEENCFYVGLHFLILSVYIKGNPIWFAYIRNGVGYRLQCKQRGNYN